MKTIKIKDLMKILEKTPDLWVELELNELIAARSLKNKGKIDLINDRFAKIRTGNRDFSREHPVCNKIREMRMCKATIGLVDLIRKIVLQTEMDCNPSEWVKISKNERKTAKFLHKRGLVEYNDEKQMARIIFLEEK